MVRATSVEEALALVAVDRVDAIVVGRRGRTTTVAQRASACATTLGGRHVPLLVVGARADPDATVGALAAGADDYVPAMSGPLVARAG